MTKEFASVFGLNKEDVNDTSGQKLLSLLSLSETRRSAGCRSTCPTM